MKFCELPAISNLHPNKLKDFMTYKNDHNFVVE